MNMEVYPSTSKWLHWIIAFLVIVMLCGGFFLEDVPKSMQDTVYTIHKSIGLTILCLMILRLVWVHYVGRPVLPRTLPLWERIASHIVQYGLYVFVIFMPLSGWIMSVASNYNPSYFGLFSVNLPFIPQNKALADNAFLAHKTIAYILIVLVALHILGALKHHFWDKDNILRRMLPGGWV